MSSNIHFLHATVWYMRMVTQNGKDLVIYGAAGGGTSGWSSAPQLFFGQHSDGCLCIELKGLPIWLFREIRPPVPCHVWLDS
jgi:hypothetical protein